MSRLLAVPGLEVSTYKRHALHAEDRVWVEKNCYIDIWIEVLHALNLNPLAVMPFVVAIDFEGDQWTFFKPPHDELRDLYGVDVQELNVWRPLLEHAQEYLADNKLISTEADAFWLPDTAGTDYQRQHTKTTIVIADLDVAQRRLGYFHNAGYHVLEGEDFVQTFRVGFPADPTFMPLFAESVRYDRIHKLDESELVKRSQVLLKKHLQRRPLTNPITKFAARFAQDLPMLQARGLGHYHAWAFATTRQVGAACELAALQLRWMQSVSGASYELAAAAYEQISTGAKTFILKGARAINAKRDLDMSETFADWALAYDRAVGDLTERLK